MEPFAEQPSRVRTRSVIVIGKPSAGFVPGPDMAEIPPLRSITGEGAAFMIRLGFGRVERELAAALRRETVGAHPVAGEIIGGELPDRQVCGKTRGECICSVVVLVSPLEGRDPQRIGTASRDRAVEVGRRRVEIEAQTARRRFAEKDRIEPGKRRRVQRLLAPAPHPRLVSAALPGP